MIRAMKHPALKIVLLACLAAAPVFASAHDDGHEGGDGFVVVDENTDTTNPNLKHFVYEYSMNKESDPNYDQVRDAMTPVFKGTFADKSDPNSANPMIGMTEFDLNNDKLPEIIAFPIEFEEQGDVLCGSRSLCPHYILDRSSNPIKVVGILPAFAVDRGDDIKNGYWTLKAFTMQDNPEKFSHFDMYAFDPKTKKYMKQEEAKKTE